MMFILYYKNEEFYAINTNKKPMQRQHGEYIYSIPKQKLSSKST